MSLVQDVDLLAATPGRDINWLEDVDLLEEDGVPAVFDRYSNSFLKIYFSIPPATRTRSPEGADQAPTVRGLYGIALKERHCKFAQPELDPGRGLADGGCGLQPTVLEGWEPPQH